MPKFMAKARARMEKKGTVGSLRAAAQRAGILSGKGDTLTPGDLDRLEAKARSMMKGGRREEGVKLLRKVLFARNAMKASRSK